MKKPKRKSFIINQTDIDQFLFHHSNKCCGISTSIKGFINGEKVNVAWRSGCGKEIKVEYKIL